MAARLHSHDFVVLSSIGHFHHLPFYPAAQLTLLSVIAVTHCCQLKLMNR